MQPIVMFMLLVGFIASMQIIDSIIKFLAKNRTNVHKTGKRDDWYCFFRLSDLLGTDWKTVGHSHQRKSINEWKRKEERRRQANRPMLYA